MALSIGFSLGIGMEHELNLEDLTNTDPAVRQAMTEKCLYFQSPEGFRWELFESMANASSSLQQRVFALVSLENLISKHSESLSADIVQKLKQSYPFWFGSSPDNISIVRFTGHLCVTFLLKLISIDDLPNYLTPDILSDQTFAASIIGELAYSLSLSTLPDSTFLTEIFPNLYRRHILQPLADGDLHDEVSSYLIYLLEEIHDECPVFAAQFVRDPETLPIYIRLASLLWLWHPQDSITGLFESLLELQNVPEELLRCMTDLCISDFLEAYSIMLIPDSETTEEVFDFAHQAFRLRLMLLFSLIEKNGMYKFDDLLVILSKCLVGPTPSVVIDTAIGLTSLLHHQPEIDQEFKLQFVEICIYQLSIGASELPNAVFDFYMSTSMFNSSIIDLVKAIYETQDGDKIAEELFRFIPLCLSDKATLLPVTKILNGILKCKKAEKSDTIKSLSLTLSVDLLSTINNCDITVQAKICNLLTKLLPHLQLEPAEATSFFNALLDLLLNHRPGCYSAFGKYFSTFAKIHEKSIDFPISLLKSVPTRNPGYLYISEILDRFHRDESIDPYIGVITQLKWFSEEFDPNDPTSLRRANIDVQEALEKTTKPEIDASSAAEIANYLTSCAGKIVELSDTTDQTVTSQLTFLITSVANAINQIEKMYPAASISKLVSPPQINVVSRLYLDRIVVPLARALSPQILTTKAVFSRIVRDCTALLSQSIGNSSEIIKYTCAVCAVAEYCDTDSATRFFSTALQIDDQKVFRQVVSCIPKHPIDVVQVLLPTLLKYNDLPAIDKLSDMLHEIFEKNGNDPSVFSHIPLFSQQILESLRKQLTVTKQKKAQRRDIKKALIQIMSNTPSN